MSASRQRQFQLPRLLNELRSRTEQLWLRCVLMGVIVRIAQSGIAVLAQALANGGADGFGIGNAAEAGEVQV